MIETPGGHLRRLSLQEAAAVQGFPEDYLFAAAEQRAWKLIAQAIPIYVGRAILKATCTAKKVQLTTMFGTGGRARLPAKVQEAAGGRADKGCRSDRPLQKT